MIVSDRKDLEIDGKRKQCSGPEDRRILRRLPTVSHRKNPKIFRHWNTVSMKSPEFPGTDRFLAVLSDLAIGLTDGPFDK
jgi:hypothetical protein